jgi:hypothetical protein
MKTRGVVIGIILILAILYSPALAVSKSDLISQYKTGQFPGPATQIPTPIPTPQIPSWIVTPPPTPAFDRFNQGSASISVLSDPAGAVVYLDGKLIGNSPVTISGLAAKSTSRSGSEQPRPYQIKLTKIGYQDYVTTLMVTEGQTTTISAALIPFVYTKREINSTKPIPVPTTASGTGTVWVTSLPTGASVYLDGVCTGVTTVVITGVPSGSHNLRVTLGGVDYPTQITRDSRYWLVGNSEVLYAPGPLHIHLTQQGRAVSVERIPAGKPNTCLYSD